VPDIVTLSKSLSGYGLPFAMVLFRPELDVWAPGEHNGTFRGFNPAFVTARKTLDFWTDDAFGEAVRKKSALAMQRLEEIASTAEANVRGRGLMLGIAFEDQDLAGSIARECYANGLIIETAGINDEVLKLMPALTISEEELTQGLDIIAAAVKKIAGKDAKSAAA